MKQTSKLEIINKYQGRVDFHGYTVEEAKNEIQNILNRVNSIIWEIHVIHGYNNGTAIRNMIRKIKHPRIKNIYEAYLNEGKTILYLNHKYE